MVQVPPDGARGRPSIALLTLLARSPSLAELEPRQLFRTSERRQPWPSPWATQGMGWLSGQAPESSLFSWGAVSFPVVVFPVRLASVSVMAPCSGRSGAD